MKPALLPSLFLLSLAGCGADAPPPQQEREPVAPAVVTAEAFGTLAWLEGQWRGEMPDGTPFFEAYRVMDDSTIASYNFADSAATTPSDSGRIELRGGRVTTGGEGRLYAVTEIRPGFVRFEPQVVASNSFTWEQTGPDAWTATLTWPATEGQPAREVVYRMRRR